MQNLQMIMNASAVPVIVSLLALPWLAVSVMHAMSMQFRAAANDAWNLRAAAALRWTRDTIDPTPTGRTVIRFPSRKAPRVNAVQPRELHAA